MLTTVAEASFQEIRNLYLTYPDCCISTGVELLLKTSRSCFLVPWRLSRSGCKRWVSRTRSLLLLLLPQGRKAVGGSPRQGRARACHRRSSHYMSALIGGYGSKPLSGEIFPRFGSRAPASVYFLLSSLRPMQIWSAEEFVYKVDFLLSWFINVISYYK